MQWYVVTAGFVLGVFMLVGNLPTAESQLDPTMIMSIVNGMSRKDKCLIFAGMLNDHPLTYEDLENALISALPIIGFDHPPGHFMNHVLSWALHHLSDVLKNEEVLGILKIFITELNNHKPEGDWYLNSTSNDSFVENRDFYVQKLFSSLDYTGMIVDILQYRSVRNFFPYNSTDRQLNGQCYSDTMDFFDRLFHGDDWALNMFDAVGKPTTGIWRGVLYFMGTYDQCLNVQATIPVNASLGEDQAEAEVNFQGRYCRATFIPPKFLVENILGKYVNHTYGVPQKLSLGMCLPSSCQGEDIEGLLHLGLLGSLFDISVDQFVCLEPKDFKTDNESHVVIGILGAIIVLMMISSTVDLLFLKPSRESTSEHQTYAISDMTSHDNEGFTDITENNALEMKNKANEDKIVADYDNKQRNGLKNGHMVNGDGKHDASIDSDLTENILDVDNDESTSKKLMRSFSIFTNIPAVVSIETKEKDIPCLYGLRVLSIMLIVLGNTFLYVAQSVSEVPVAVDMMDSFKLMNRWTMQLVMSASLATDTFFMISGCLITYWFLMKDEANISGERKLTTWIKFYAGKYWKMTPPYMLVMVTFVYLYMYLGEGPMWPENIAVADKCRTDWWKHLLYISNLVGVDGVPAEEQCMTWSWYIAVNMQFYLIAPFILTFMAFSSTMGLAITAILGVAGIISAGVKESEVGGEILTSREDGGAYWNNVFIKPWCRVSTFCVGIFLGFILQKLSHRTLNKWLALLFWALSIVVALTIIYIPYTKFVDGLEPWSAAHQAVYESLARPVWALCMAWIVYACHNNLGGPLSDFLSWRGFVPLSRLTYLVFLIHPVLMVLVVYSKRTLIHLDDFEMAYQFIGHIVVNFAAAFFASLAFDLPFRNLRRIFHRKSLDEPY